MNKVLTDDRLRYIYPLVHALLMLLLLGGLYLCWVFPWYALPHLAGVLWMVWFHIRYDYCILTKLEKDAVERSGRVPYSDGFYQHYLFRKVFGADVSHHFAKNFMIVTKVVPGLIPALYPLIRLIP